MIAIGGNMYYIGIDVGGTDVKTAIVNKKGEILAKAQCPTIATRHYSEVTKDFCKSALEALEKSGKTLDDIASIGVGIPGIADQKTGRVIFCTNLNWFDVPLKEEIQKYINKPVYIDNDATVAGYAESVNGISKGRHSSVFITLGTGIGSGIIINGKPWSGFHGAGSELGHATMNFINGIRCTCGNKGCVERYCSATAIIRMAKEAMEGLDNCLMLNKSNGDLDNLTAKIVIDCAKEGDPIALSVFNDYIDNMCNMIRMVICIIDPEVIVLGGGVSRAGDFLVDAINAKIHNYLLFKTVAPPEILIAKLGADAGVIGAAMLGLEEK